MHVPEDRLLARSIRMALFERMIGEDDCMAYDVLTLVAGLVAAGIGSWWLAWRLNLPSILVLLVVGFIVGPVGNWLSPDALLGELLLPFVSVSVALILFEGGMSLRLSELRRVGGVVRNLITIGALVTWAVSAVAAHLIFGLDPRLCVLLGAVLVVTGPTVVQPLLQHIRPGGPVGSILRWEGIAIDPVGAVLAVLVFEWMAIKEPETATIQVAWGLAKTLVVGGGAGLVAAAILTLFLRRYWIPDALQSPVALMCVIAVFAFCNAVQHESGLLATTVMGIAMANQKSADVGHILEFKENLRILLISALFILLSARLEVDDLTGIWGRGLLFLAVLVVVARPLCVFVSSLGSKLSRSEKLFLAWMAPRGIVAAAVSSVFALRLEATGYEGASVLVPITFLTIIGTVAIYGLTGPLVARRLGVADPNPQGVLFVGANDWARAMAEALQKKNLRVLLVDSNRDHTSAARMAGLPAYTGSILAEQTLEELDLGGIGRILAVTPNDWVNVLAVQRYRRVFGQAACYQLAPYKKTSGKHDAHKHLYGRLLFGEDRTYDAIEGLAAAGAKVKTTRLSETFDYAAFREMYGAGAIPLFTISENGKLAVVTDRGAFDPKAGQTLIALVHEPKAEQEARQQETASPNGLPDAES